MQQRSRVRVAVSPEPDLHPPSLRYRSGHPPPQGEREGRAMQTLQRHAPIHGILARCDSRRPISGLEPDQRLEFAGELGVGSTLSFWQSFSRRSIGQRRRDAAALLGYYASAGRPAGAQRPTTFRIESLQRNSDLANVGTFGSVDARAGPLTARPRRVPDSICPLAEPDVEEHQVDAPGHEVDWRRVRRLCTARERHRALATPLKNFGIEMRAGCCCRRSCRLFLLALARAL